ncbi:glycogen synthase [Rodentibacter pneumotropicus]|uniref:starch synthase n=1 Tax=Rodentibacter pneumotropicus TaxID=758 RepID=A0A3S4TX10_9PAST|nr:glycogen synthase [Rodentibacter pneumotropicus]
MPAYPAIYQGIGENHIVAEFDNFAGHVILRYGEYKGVGIYLVDAPHLYDREGNPYHDVDYNDYADNYKRFALLGWVGAELSTGLDPWWRAEIVHAHDWHAGLTAAYLFNKGKPANPSLLFIIWLIKDNFITVTYMKSGYRKECST